MPRLRHAAKFTAAILFLVAMALSMSANASIALLVEEPFGTFGAFNPTGHAAIYLDGVCADAPARLRLCRSGELGVVISRYHRVDGYDWVAMPLVPYLYAVDDVAEIPDSATPALRSILRDRYRRAHLQDLAPDREDGATPSGEWIQLVGSSYDRRIYGFELATTRDQDLRIIAELNDSRNRSHFNLFYRNCADFARSILRSTYPGSIPRNSMADFWLTTPKHMAKLVTKFGERTPEAEFRTFQIAQVPGSIPRSRKVDGIAESLVRSKKYIVPLAFLSPTTAASLAVAYVGRGRFGMPVNAPVMALERVDSPAIMVDDSRMELGLAEITKPVLACSEVPPPVEMTGGGTY